MKTVAGQHTDNEDCDDDHIGNGTAQAIATQLACGAFDIDDGEGDDKRDRRIEQNVELSPHVGSLGAQSLDHLQEVMYGKKKHGGAKQPSRHFVAPYSPSHLQTCDG